MPLLVHIVNWVIEILIALILVASLLSWFRPDPRHPLVKLLHALVDPLLHPIRAVVPPLGGLDFSSFIAMIILWLLQSLIQHSVAL